MVMPNKQKRIEAHCRDVIKACLNVVEEKGDTYVAIHKDDEAECVVLVSMIRTHPILSVIIADKILFDNKCCQRAEYRVHHRLAHHCSHRRQQYLYVSPVSLDECRSYPRSSYGHPVRLHR